MNRIIELLRPNRRFKRWLNMRRGALAVVAACQRNSGLWLLRTTPFSTQDAYTSSGNLEDRRRGEEIFGVQSITVTWSVFVALREIFGRLPDHPRLAAARTTIYQQRADEGGYGTVTGWRTHHILPTCRHTATALLTFLQFSDSFSPPLSYAQGRETIQWLLGSALKPDGGWPFARRADLEPGKAAEGLEPLATACAIAALCEFLRHFSDKRELDRVFAEDIDKAIASGFARLAANNERGGSRESFDSAR